MSEDGQGILDEAKQTLLKRKFGSLLGWKKPELGETIGPFRPEVFDSFEDRRVHLITECSRVLDEMAETDLILIYEPDGEEPNDKKEVWRDFLRDETAKLQAREPKLLAGGFGHPAVLADFTYWGQMEKYNLHEALMLSVGVEPKLISETEVYKAEKDSKHKKISPMLSFLVKRQELFVRKFPSGGYGFLSVPPSFLLNWFEEVEMEVHSKFLEVLRKRTLKSLGVKSIARNEEVSKTKTDRREIDKVAQLFAAMAIEHLGYQPTAPRSPIPKEITDLAASMGLKISDDTVRKYLKLGASFIPNNWEPY